MFTGLFTLAAASGFNVFSLTDTSDYSNEPVGTFSGRTVTLITTDLRTLVPTGTTTTYIDFPFAGGDTITIAAMNRDYSVNVVVDWLTTDPQPGSTYQSSIIMSLLSYNTNNEYGIIQAMTATPLIVSHANYWLNLGLVQTENENCIQATYYQQQVSAQRAINHSAEILANQLTNF
jgi:hypothetical protein